MNDEYIPSTAKQENKWAIGRSSVCVMTCSRTPVKPAVATVKAPIARIQPVNIASPGVVVQKSRIARYTNRYPGGAESHRAATAADNKNTTAPNTDT